MAGENFNDATGDVLLDQALLSWHWPFWPIWPAPWPWRLHAPPCAGATPRARPAGRSATRGRRVGIPRPSLPLNPPLPRPGKIQALGSSGKVQGLGRKDVAQR